MIEVLETSTEIVEVIEQGPAGPIGGLDHNPLLTLLASSKATQLLPLHDGTIGTEVTVLFGPANDGLVDVTDGIMTTLTDLDGFYASIEIHTTSSGPGGKIVGLTVWSEVSLDDGVTWLLVPDSLHVTQVQEVSSGSHSISFAEGTSIPAGVMTRLRATKQGDTGTVLNIAPAVDLLTSNGLVSGDATKSTMLYRAATNP